eukprot:3454035-Rhodomonas_salina.4
MGKALLGLGQLSEALAAAKKAAQLQPVEAEMMTVCGGRGRGDLGAVVGCEVGAAATKGRAAGRGGQAPCR